MRNQIGLIVLAASFSPGCSKEPIWASNSLGLSVNAASTAEAAGSQPTPSLASSDGSVVTATPIAVIAKIDEGCGTPYCPSDLVVSFEKHPERVGDTFRIVGEAGAATSVEVWLLDPMLLVGNSTGWRDKAHLLGTAKASGSFSFEEVLLPQYGEGDRLFAIRPHFGYELFVGAGGKFTGLIFSVGP